MDSLQQLREQNINATKKAIKASVKQDTLAIHAQNSLEALQKTTNTLSEKLREWFELFLPQFTHSIKDNKEFAKQASTKTKEENEKMGGVLSQKDVSALTSFAKTISNLFNQMAEIEKYLQTTLQEICPNTLAIAEAQTTAKLLTLAGSLQKLSELPSSTIQLLGAEKALFRHLKEGEKTPKFGVLHAHELVQKAKPQNKGKVARALADKISIAAKIDFFKGEFIGDKLRKKIEEKFA